jgi:hypothetical protein
VDIVVNGISERTYDVKAFSQDPFGIEKRTKYMESILRDMQTKQISDFAEQAFGISMYENPKQSLPENQEELELHMQLSYKQSIEIAEEQAIATILEDNKYENIRKRLNYDLTVLGMACVKNTFNTSEGIKVEYVDPAALVYSFSESPYFDDIYYVGEVKNVPVNELKKQFPELENDQLDEILKKSIHDRGHYSNSPRNNHTVDINTAQVLYFNYKTYMNEVYKLKETGSGASKIILKDDQFNPPQDLETRFGKISRSLEVVYEGALILGTDIMLKWELSKNMMRPKSDDTKVKMNYNMVAPRMYQGRIESLVSRITSFADMIQLTHLKLQQVLTRMVPDGIYIDADGLAEIDLGNGTNYNPAEALNMFFQTGSIIGRSFTSEGDINPGKIPIQEVTSGAGGQKIGALINTYNYYLQMIRDVTGLNEARDGSTPDKNALVGVQKLAAANSNTATRHILQSSLFLTAELAESLSLRISDVIEFSPTRESLINKIGAHNTAVISELHDIHIHDFGIFIELAPDEEEQQLLENNIQVAIAQQTLDIEDAIDIREIKNVKLANQLLKLRRRKKKEMDQQIAQQNMQAQAQANAQTQQAVAQAEAQKQQVIAQGKAQLAQLQAQLDTQKLQSEAKIKKELMATEFEYNMKLRGLELEGQKSKEKEKEDRKDKRTKIQASQQSELINQRQNNKPPKDFESSGNDTLNGNFGLGYFEPR